MFKYLLFLSTFVLFGLLPAPHAFAQDGEIKAVGAVTAKSGTSITVATGDKDKPSQTFALNAETKVSRGRNPIAIDAVEVGETAGIVGIQQDGKLVATLVQVRPKP